MFDVSGFAENVVVEISATTLVGVSIAIWKLRTPEARQGLRSAVCSRFAKGSAWVADRGNRAIDMARPAFLYFLAVLHLGIIAVHLAVGVVHPSIFLGLMVGVPTALVATVATKQGIAKIKAVASG